MRVEARRAIVIAIALGARRSVAFGDDGALAGHEVPSAVATANTALALVVALWEQNRGTDAAVSAAAAAVGAAASTAFVIEADAHF